MAMIAGLGEVLSNRPLGRGVVHLLFQPAEETGTGASAVLDDPAFDRFRPDFAVAIHNMPGFPLHAMVIKSGSITAAVRSFIVRFTGRVAHASEPEKGENPSFAVADLLRDADALAVTDQHDPNFRLVTPVHVSVGSVAYGVAAGEGEVHFTIRASSNDGLAELQAEISEIAKRVADRDGLAVEIEVVEDFYANINDPEVTERVRCAAQACGHEIVAPDVGMRAGEDFGLFTERFPCCLVLLGAGEEHLPIHNAGYDFPDELITTGVELFERIVRDAEENFA
jgi:amidohydrolase